jgi:hypothetical protein
MLKIVSAVAGLALLLAFGTPDSARAAEAAPAPEAAPVPEAAPPPVKKVVKKKRPKVIVRYVARPVYAYRPYGYARPYYPYYRPYYRPYYGYYRRYYRPYYSYGYYRPYYWGGYRPLWPFF